MAVIHSFRNFRTFFREGDQTLLIHGDVAVFPEIFRGVAHRRLGHAEMAGNIDGADIAQGLF